MNEVILFNPAISTSNIGDKIIFKFAKEGLDSIFSNSAYIEWPTQMPISNKMIKRFANVNYRFVCGSNLLQSNMLASICRTGITTHGIRQWDISMRQAKLIAPAILLGCGWQNYSSKINNYTKTLWKTVLSKEYYHSVRDEYTLERLKSIGITNVINTGCPTTWKLTPEFCEKIPREKASTVVTTLTSYRPSVKQDEEMLSVLLKNYLDVFIWLQGIDDEKYFATFPSRIRNRIKVIPPRLDRYVEFLQENVDYVGTRLHGGIMALNQGKRTIVIGIDNRAAEMERDIHLPVISRGKGEKLEEKIQSVWNTGISIPRENIERFKQQFTIVDERKDGGDNARFWP